LAIVSGRGLENIESILGGDIAAIAGLHGLERRTASGVRIDVPAHPGLGQAREEFQRLAESRPGLLLEDKGLGLALHYRRAPEFEKTAREFARRLAASTGLALQEGDMVVELLTPGHDKGSAILAFMAEAPFAGAVPVFMGDDLADEHGFAAVSASGGFGICVGPVRETKARYRFADVNAAVTWLQTLTTEPSA
jgi:trehalose 6-phosphate phosphatase